MQCPATSFSNSPLRSLPQFLAIVAIGSVAFPNTLTDIIFIADEITSVFLSSEEDGCVVENNLQGTSKCSTPCPKGIFPYFLVCENPHPLINKVGIRGYEVNSPPGVLFCEVLSETGVCYEETYIECFPQFVPSPYT